MQKQWIQLPLIFLLGTIIFSSCKSNSKGESKMKQGNRSHLSQLEVQLNRYINSKKEFIAVALQDVRQNFYLGFNDTVRVPKT